MYTFAAWIIIGSFVNKTVRVNRVNSRKKDVNFKRSNQLKTMIQEIKAILVNQGLFAAENFIKQQNLTPKEYASLLIYIAKNAFRTNGMAVQPFYRTNSDRGSEPILIDF